MPDQHAAATEHAILQEITAPLESLPDDPLSVIHADFPVVALRGYDREAVDEYVRRTRQLVAELHASRSPEAAVRRALERVGEQISGILQRAHETAEEITAQSRIEAEDRLEQARVEAQQIIENAEARVRELDADTDRIWLERQRIVADADDLAGQLKALARAAAQRFPEDDEEDGTAGVYDDQEELGFADGEPGGEADDDATVALPAVPAGPAVPATEADGEPDGADELGPGAAEPDEPGAGVGEPVAGADESVPGPSEAVTSGDDPVAGAGEPVPGAGEPGAGVGEAAAGADQASPAVSDDSGGGTDDSSEDTTAIIRPASQAASRRLHDT